MARKQTQSKSPLQTIDKDKINTDLLDKNILAKTTSPYETKTSPVLKRQVSQCAIQADPEMPFGKFFNRELNHTK
jgi:hypothetical protein